MGNKNKTVPILGWNRDISLMCLFAVGLSAFVRTTLCLENYWSCPASVSRPKSDLCHLSPISGEDS